MWRSSPNARLSNRKGRKPYCINCEKYGHMANYSGCPKFPKPRKGTQGKTNTNTVNSIVRPGTSYSQAASTPPQLTRNGWHHMSRELLLL
ncbi:hypothetical protein TNCV_1849451 [Trichonephila clavipes]|nr:hypothetical protein TNCV_1849451 [Trichonephila clavipes]